MEQPGVATVLVVDDDPVVRRVLVLQLQHLGYRAVDVGRGREALNLLAQRSVDAILLDVVMPDMNGIDVLLHIKGDERTEHIPVLVMTGLADQEMRLTALASGAEELLSKPVDRLELGSRLRNVLRVKTLTDRIRQSQPQRTQATGDHPEISKVDQSPEESACWRAALRAASRSPAHGFPTSLMRLDLDGRVDHPSDSRLLAEFATDRAGHDSIAASVRQAAAGNAVEFTATLQRMGLCTICIEPVWQAVNNQERPGIPLPVGALVALVLPLPS